MMFWSRKSFDGLNPSSTNQQLKKTVNQEQKLRSQEKIKKIDEKIWTNSFSDVLG